MTKVDTSFLAELKASGRLPSPTGVALTILELTRKPDTSTEDLVEVLKGDPSLAGQVLKYANSAEMGSRTEITSLNDALVRLGMSMVRQLCLGFSVLSNARSGPCPRFDYQRYWARSLATAVSCQVLSRRISSVSPDEGFTCGLLGHIGSLALASVYPDEYSRILDAWNAGSNAELRKLEQDTLSIDHHQVSAAIFKDWGLPEYYQQAVLNQDDLAWIGGPGHAPERGRSEKLANLLNIADLAAEICLEDGPERHRLVLDFVHVGEAHQ
ncbi:HDOD domain-containing protein, partial [bacterium]|nr:HDOD domain-containing protein [bacterium]